MSTFTKVKEFVWSKRFLKHFAILVGVYCVIVFGTIFYLNVYTNHGEKIEVPNLVGKNVNAIAGTLEELDLQYEILDSIYDPKKVEGTILSQDPGPTFETGVPVKGGRVIRLRVSKRTQLIEVPQCVDKSQRFAENILKNRGFKFKVEFKSTSESDGAVMEQYYNGKKVLEKTKIPIGSTIKLIVGRNIGGEPIQIPDVVGLTIFEAKSRLVAMGNFNVVPVCDGCTTYADSSAAIVETQSPEFFEGAFVPKGATFTVFAKKGGSNP